MTLVVFRFMDKDVVRPWYTMYSAAAGCSPIRCSYHISAADPVWHRNFPADYWLAPAAHRGYSSACSNANADCDGCRKCRSRCWTSRYVLTPGWRCDYRAWECRSRIRVAFFADVTDCVARRR